MFSIAAPLAGPYLWVTNTEVYPWRLSLKRLDATGKPEMYVRRRHNMTNCRRQKNPQSIVTRLYPLGYGDGVNQLEIADVNGGVPYLQSPKTITDTFITEIRRDYKDVERFSITVANRETSIASSVAAMADRQRIEQTYAQGATQIYSQALQANCDSASGTSLT